MGVWGGACVCVCVYAGGYRTKLCLRGEEESYRGSLYPWPSASEIPSSDLVTCLTSSRTTRADRVRGKDAGDGQGESDWEVACLFVLFDCWGSGEWLCVV